MHDAGLPIVPYLARITQTLTEGTGLLLSAAPGAGKTTQVPLAWLGAAPASARAVLVEPRRVAALAAARWLAEACGEPVGEQVGLQMREDLRCSARTRLTVMTPGMLRLALRDGQLWSAQTTLLLDEVHERYMEAEVAMALWRASESSRRPRLALMSATLGADLREAFRELPLLEVPGRNFPLTVRHVPALGREKLPQQVLRALQQLEAQCPADELGRTLVFLPSVRSLEQAREACKGRLRRSVDLLHGRLSLAQQQACLSAETGPEVVLATNLCESALTVPGVRSVVDSGLERRADQQLAGLTRLQTWPAPRFSLVQRAGRAARLGPGTVYKLFAASEEVGRPAAHRPALLRGELLEAQLLCHALGHEAASLAWVAAPPETAWRQGEATLRQMGVLAGEPVTLTAMGRRLLDAPCDLRMAVAVHRLCELGDALVARHLLHYAEVGPEGRELFDLEQLSYEDRCGRRVPAPRRRRIQRFVEGLPEGRQVEDASLARALCLAFPERVAQRRGAGSYLTAQGMQCEAPPETRAAWLIALDGVVLGTQRLRLSAYLELDASWLLEQEALIQSESLHCFDASSGTVREREVLRFLKLELSAESRLASPSSATQRCLAEPLLQKHFAWLAASKEVEPELARLRCAALHGLVGLRSEEDVARSLALAAAEQAVSVEDLKQLGLEGALLQYLGFERLQRLRRLLPFKLQLQGGSWLRVRYRVSGDAVIAAPLQRFWELDPAQLKLADGRLSPVCELLAPNQRPVQVTRDLQSFWSETYPELYRALSRRYPRHHWPAP